jgi:hypothetical protein
MSDNQAEAANRVARQLAGAVVDGGNPPPPPAGPEHAKELLYVRLPCDGWGDHRFAQEVGAILNRNGVFRRDRLPVVINRETAAVEPMSVQRFRTYCSKHMITSRFVFNDKTGQLESKIEKTMGVETARGCLESDWFVDQQRSLRRVNMVRMPILRQDGRIELLPNGYDPESRIFTTPSDIKVDDSMPIERARAVIDDLVREFPFGDFKEDTPANREAGVVGLSRSKAVHLGNMVSLYGAGLMHELVTRLHFVYVANAQASGKTLLAKTAIVPIFGPSRATPKPDNEDDLRKRLTTAAVAASPYLFLDDLDGFLRSQSLNAFMMAPTWTDRSMGSHTELAAVKETVVIITGNNLSLSTDIARRTLRCNLYTEEFNAQNRTIQRVIDEEYLARPSVRAEILSALWCFIREWDRAGRPKGKDARKGFEQWSETFGGIVMNAGFGNPLEDPPTDDYSGDPESADMMTLVEVLVADMAKLHDPQALDAERQLPIKKKEYTFEELVEAAQSNDCFSGMIEGNTKENEEGDKYIVLNQRSKSALGKMFAARYGGRKFRLKDGRVVRFGHRGRNRHRRYAVEILDSIKPPVSPPSA